MTTSDSKGIVISDDERALLMRQWQVLDVERRQQAIAIARALRAELTAETEGMRQIEAREFEALYIASVRIYLITRIEALTRVDNKSLADALLSAVRENLDVLGR